MPLARFNYDNASLRIKEFFRVETLDSFGSFSNPEVMAAGVLLDYIETTQKGKIPRLERPIKISENDVMEIDAATRRNLELIESISSDKSTSLLSTIDKTITGAGGRLLSYRLANPLKNIQEINNRLDVVEFFIEHSNIRDDLRSLLKSFPDIERALNRISLGRGGPRDLASIKQGLEIIPSVKNLIKSFSKDDKIRALPSSLDNILENLGFHNTIVENLKSALAEELPLLSRDGNFIKEGYSPALDEIKAIREDSHKIILNYQSKYSDSTKIPNLKIKYNNVIGYFIEVPTKFATQMLEDKFFIHRQSVLNAARFTTVELTELENKIRGAADKSLAMELEIFENLITEVLINSDNISKTARSLAEIDVASSIAELSADKSYCRPLIDDSLAFDIKDGRHPVVEHSIQKDNSGTFIGNNCELSPDTSLIWLLTGPNMAGKSTFLRQNAIIAIMAQMGCFVPAQSARIGLVDKIFSRVGASDDLAKGRSTFMVEMVETASILNQATERSFVILDEIGRGTATFDGLSIAWAVIEHLHEVNKCRSLFATHYHELTSLTKKLNLMSLHCMKIKEFNDQVIFLHEVITGAADRSYGIHVAKLAGLPPVVIKRAEQVLENLEKDNKATNINSLTDDLPLFSAVLNVTKKENPSFSVEEIQVIKTIEEIYPDELSPKEALEKLYEIKSLLKNTQ